MNNDLVKRDLACNWHPYTQMKDCETLPPIAAERAEGMKIFDQDGKFYYDTISSWWCNVHGHGHPSICEAIRRQAGKLDHVMFAGFTHAPAVELSEALVKISPERLNRVFYSDNGSTAVEVALKMAVQYWAEKGEKSKTRFISLDRGYHGDTAGAMSVSGESQFNRAFRALMFEGYFAPTPYCYRCRTSPGPGSCSRFCLTAAENILKEHRDKIAAMIIEPMVLGAGGMIVYPSFYLKGIRELTEKYDVLLIADEVATGFGRTGRMFACEHAGITPDLLCVSKGITSGYLPLGATLATEEIFGAFYANHREGKTFYHGHTYTANPIACSAAVCSLDLFDKENSLARTGMINVLLHSFLEVAKAFPFVGDTRDIGAIGAIELVKDKNTKEPFPPERRMGLEVYKKALEENLILRPLGDVIYFFLPLCAKKEELEDIFERSTRVLASLQC
jgi:adenosylmethionine-8-amino-7-oxononanoate transaminase